jgi:hypothetical protein
MTLPASGQISLNQVNVELGQTGTTQISMNDTSVRDLFDVSSGQISMSNGHGKSDSVPINPFGFKRPLNGTGSHSNTQAGPNNAYWRRYCLAFVITHAEMQAAGCGGQGRITQLQLAAQNNIPAYPSFPNYSVGMSHDSTTSNTANVSGSRSGETVFYNNNTHNWSTNQDETYFPADNTFYYNGSDALAIRMAWGQIQPTYNRSGIVRTTTTGRMYYARTDSSGIYSLSQSCTSYVSYRPSLILYWSGGV